MTGETKSSELRLGANAGGTSERSTGNTRRQGGITKTGNSSAREGTGRSGVDFYRHSAGVGTTHQRRQQLLPQRVREIAWKAQSRLCARYRQLAAKGKRNTVVITAIAREIAAFRWAIAREGARACTDHAADET